MADPSRFVSRQLIEDVLTGLVTAGEAARRIDAALAEREAQCVALREALEECCIGDHEKDEPPCWCGGDATHGHDDFCVRYQRLLTSTADAAARYEARARQEGAEEMRQACLALVEMQSDTRTLARLIRHLDALAPAARRG